MVGSHQPDSLPPATYRRRLAGLQTAMKAARIDAVLVTPSTSFRYLTGIAPGRSERLIALLVPRRDSPAVVGPHFERERLATNALTREVHTWREEEDPYLLCGRLLQNWRVAPSRLAIEETTEFRTVAGLTRVLGHAAFPSAAALLSGLRMRKDAEELDRMRRAVRETHAARAAALKRLRIGMREREFAALLSAELSARGGGDPWVLAQFGPTSAIPHALGGDRRLRKSDVVLTDFGACFAGYQSDITRTAFFGTPTRKFLAILKIVREAQCAALREVRPGMACATIDASARRVIDSAGFGQNFTHRTGHGIGLDVHEEPYIVRGNAQPLQEGITFTIEPGIYLPDDFGVRWEDDMLCTGSGGEIIGGSGGEETVIGP